ncbi:hypothetical protein BV20DRAFT_413284 [Pilatotrama ljubarskyi]|nr:hypothetical protein BV20DRAFT_413284 [Pilatotrama ljubarskyi]
MNLVKDLYRSAKCHETRYRRRSSAHISGRHPERQLLARRKALSRLPADLRLSLLVSSMCNTGAFVPPGSLLQNAFRVVAQGALNAAAWCRCTDEIGHDPVRSEK